MSYWSWTQYSFFFRFYFILFLLYNIVLVFPYINMNPPRVYMCSQSWTPVPLPSPYHLSGSSQWLKIELPYDPAIPLLGIRTEETRIERDTCTPMFIAALFIIARTWKQPRCPSADEWKKSCGTYTQWSITQPLKRIHLNQFWWDGWNWSRLYRVK